MKIKPSSSLSCTQRRKLKQEKQNIAVIAHHIRGQAQLDSMLMRYADKQRKVIFRHMRPFLRFDALYPTEESTKVIDKTDFAKLREKYA